MNLFCQMCGSGLKCRCSGTRKPKKGKRRIPTTRTCHGRGCWFYERTTPKGVTTWWVRHNHERRG